MPLHEEVVVLVQEQNVLANCNIYLRLAEILFVRTALVCEADNESGSNNTGPQAWAIHGGCDVIHQTQG